MKLRGRVVAVAAGCVVAATAAAGCVVAAEECVMMAAEGQTILIYISLSRCSFLFDVILRGS